MTDYICKLQGTFANGDGWSVGLRVTSNQTEAALVTTWNAAWADAWTNGAYGLDSLYHTDTVTTQTTVATLNGTMHEVTKTVSPFAHAGTSSDTALPNRDAVLVSLRSPSIQKHGRGRMYLPAPVEGIVVSSEYTSAAMTRVKTAIQAVFTAIRADGSTIFVTNLQPLKDGTPAFQKTVITTILVARLPATQRRRTDPDSSNYV